ncbi:hypothetical protein DFQ13_101449 [Actinokineospora spheciospongiae]|nr:hypothetical protein DFQ13_101449 [Actinokineospora spheciospongiae]
MWSSIDSRSSALSLCCSCTVFSSRGLSPCSCRSTASRTWRCLRRPGQMRRQRLGGGGSGRDGSGGSGVGGTGGSVPGVGSGPGGRGIGSGMGGCAGCGGVGWTMLCAPVRDQRSALSTRFRACSTWGWWVGLVPTHHPGCHHRDPQVTACGRWGRGAGTTPTGTGPLAPRVVLGVPEGLPVGVEVWFGEFADDRCQVRGRGGRLACRTGSPLREATVRTAPGIARHERWRRWQACRHGFLHRGRSVRCLSDGSAAPVRPSDGCGAGAVRGSGRSRRRRRSGRRARWARSCPGVRVRGGTPRRRRGARVRW